MHIARVVKAVEVDALLLEFEYSAIRGVPAHCLPQVYTVIVEACQSGIR